LASTLGPQGMPEGQALEAETAAGQDNLARLGPVTKGPSQPEPAPTSVGSVSVVSDEVPLSKTDGIRALIEFREKVIRTQMPDWVAHRSILRDAMIEAFVSQHFSDPDEWFTKIPAFLRQGTNPVEKRYLEQICDVVNRIDDAGH